MTSLSIIYNGNGRYDGVEYGFTIDATDGQFGDYGFEVRPEPIRILRIPVYYEDINGDTHPVPPGTYVKVSKYYSPYEECLDTRLRVNEDGQIVFETNLDCKLYEELCSTHRPRVFLESYITAIEPGEGSNDQEVYLGQRKDPMYSIGWAHRFASSLFCIKNAGGNVWMPVGGKIIILYNHYQWTVIEYDSSTNQHDFYNRTGDLSAINTIHRGYHYMRGLDPTLSLTDFRVTAVWREGTDWYDMGKAPSSTIPKGIGNEVAVLNLLKAINNPVLIWNALAHPILSPPASNYDVLDLANELKAQGLAIDDLLTRFGMKIRLVDTNTCQPTFTWDMNDIESGIHILTLQIAEDEDFGQGLITISGLTGETYTLTRL